MDSKQFDLLTEVINLFVKKERRDRFIELLSKPKRYDDGLSDLLHDPRYFDENCIFEIPSNEHTLPMIYARLSKLGFQKQCFIISCYSDSDGKTLPSLEALEAICYNTGSMLFCPISKIAYYEGHEGWRYILKPKL